MIPRRRLVVIGNGMAGARFVENLVAGGGRDRFDIVVFGDEPHGNYNRILLSGVLAGTHRMDDIVINPLAWYAANGIRLHRGVRAERIDVAGKRVVGGDGIVEPYDVLVIATGSQPLLPPIKGLRSQDGTLKDGAFVFRTIDDCDQMIARARSARTAAVIGGGLLGIEAARGLRNHGLEVHVVHLTPHLMDVQLDPPASRILERQLQQMGLQILTGRNTTGVVGDERVTGLEFGDGSALACDMVVVAAGIRPNTGLATAAGLAVKRGIVVGDDLACDGATDVYAIGECAEHRGQLYGLVAPLWEQAQILADRLTGRRDGATYAGSRLTTKLKVAGIDVAVMGLRDAAEEDDEVVSYAEPSRGIYKKLIVRNDKLVGAILIGDGPIVPGVAQAFIDGVPLAEHRSEMLFPIPIDRPRAEPEQMADDTQICDCNVVTKAQIVDAVLRGASSLHAVCDATRAGTGCGSCRPEVERIVEMARRSADAPELLRSAPPRAETLPPEDDEVVVTLNKIERIKKEKDGLDIVPDIPAIAQGGWEAITDGDRERLKWAGVFFRRQTPGRFMMRLRIPNGFASAVQVRAIADVAEEFGTPQIDITTRQQIQIRGFGIEHVPEIGRRLEEVGLLSLQTGMDNIRNVIGCAAAGLTKGELFDASPVVHEFTRMFVGNKAFTDLPRKFNVGISGCTEHCTHAESQDLALTPAVKTTDGHKRHGFNVAVGGKMGSGGCKIAEPLDIFVEPDEAAALCREIVFLFRDHGSRAARNRARLSFLLEKWGADRFRGELERRLKRSLDRAGRDARIVRGADHIGIHKQKQAGLNYAGLLVAVGRVATTTLRDVARVAEEYGTGDVRFTTTQNVIIPNVPDAKLARLSDEPLLANLPHDPPGAMRGLVACTGIDYCHFALIETKEIALRTAEILATRLPHGQRVSTHWSGCPAGCGNHAAADIGLLGKNIRVNGELVDAVDIFIGGRAGPNARAGVKTLEDVPCADLPAVLETLIPYVTAKRGATAPASSASPSSSPKLLPPDHAIVSGRTIALLESRQSDELAGMVARLGGKPMVAPAVRERPTAEDAGPLLARICEGHFRMAIFQTGAAATALFAEAERRGRLDAVRGALTEMALVCRGPKPQAALRRQGLAATVSTEKPHTTLEVLDALDGTSLRGMPIMLLHYGERNGVLTGAIAAQGALVEDVCLYQWALPEDVEPLHDVVRRIIAGDVDALLVTSQVQIRFLLEIAVAAGRADDLVRALNEQVIVGAIGPVCASALRASGIVPDVLPASPNSASLVGAVADYFELTAREEEPHS